MGTENNLWKFERDQIIFHFIFTDIWSLKYNEISVSGAKIFFEEYRNKGQEV